MDTGPVVSAADPPSVAEDPPAGERAQTIAQYQAALAAAQESVRRARAALATAGELQDSLEPMPVIEQAKGIVMAQQRCGPDEAFDLLRRASQRKNVKVSVLAAQIVEQIAVPHYWQQRHAAQPADGTVTGRYPGARLGAGCRRLKAQVDALRYVHQRRKPSLVAGDQVVAAAGDRPAQAGLPDDGGRAGRVGVAVRAVGRQRPLCPGRSTIPTRWLWVARDDEQDLHGLDPHRAGLAMGKG